MFLSPFWSGGGNRKYLTVKLIDASGKRKNKRVHRLVAEAFIPNPDNLETINHRDERKENNDISNLEWLSRGDNVRYGTGHQRGVDQLKKKVYCEELGKTWESITACAADLEVNVGQVSSCCKRNGTCHGLHLKFLLDKSVFV